MFLIELYRTWISPARPPTCRYTPTCSEYAVESLREWGLLRGLALASWRLLKCGPWTRGGWDPVPQRHGRRSDTGVGHGETGQEHAPHPPDPAPACAQPDDAGDNEPHRSRPPHTRRMTRSAPPPARPENRRA